MLQGHDPPNRTLKLKSPNGPSRSLVDLAAVPRQGTLQWRLSVAATPMVSMVSMVPNGPKSQWSDDRRQWDPGLRVWYGVRT